MYESVKVKTAKDIDHKNARYVTATDILGDQVEFVVWTNRSGEGLWVDGRQVFGTSQFSATSNYHQKIKNYFLS